MAEQTYKYIIVGTGLAGASAIEGIREMDKTGPILSLGFDPDLPYDRPPLSKQLWTGAKTLDQIILHDSEFYRNNGVDLRPGTEVAQIEPAQHRIHDRAGNTFRYERLLLATGSTPKRLNIPGGDLEGIYYYRTLADYRRLRQQIAAVKSVLVIGGGFIGSEMAASMRVNGLAVTMVFPARYPGARVFPESLGRFLSEFYRSKGVEIVAEQTPISIQRDSSGYKTRLQNGREIQTDLIVVGIGVAPNIALGQAAGLSCGNGLIVNELLQTSQPDIFAAGDVALFPESGFGPRRVEHWDNAVTQGKHAGRNMAGANEPYTHLPFFFSDLFEFGYEAVGDIDSRLQTFADWQEENKTGVIYYLDGHKLRGAMMCNVWEKVDTARAMIRADKTVTQDDLRGAIR